MVLSSIGEMSEMKFSQVRLFRPCILLCVLVGCFQFAYSYQERPAPIREPAEAVGLPFSVEVLDVNPDNGEVTYNVTNDSSEIITAWSVEYRVMYSDGSVDVSYYSTDWAMASPLVAGAPGRGGLKPGETRKVVGSPASVNASNALTDIEVRSCAAILDDLTIVGRREQIDAVLEMRRIKQFVRDHWLSQIQQMVESSQSDAELLLGLKLIQEQLKDGSARYTNGRYVSDDSIARMEEKSLLAIVSEPFIEAGRPSTNSRSARFKIESALSEIEDLVATAERHVGRANR